MFSTGLVTNEQKKAVFKNKVRLTNKPYIK